METGIVSAVCIGRNCLLGNGKKIAKFLMRTFACRSTFLYGFGLVFAKTGSIISGTAASGISKKLSMISSGYFLAFFLKKECLLCIWIISYELPEVGGPSISSENLRTFRKCGNLWTQSFCDLRICNLWILNCKNLQIAICDWNADL
jgi:hypothetical protein